LAEKVSYTNSHLPRRGETYGQTTPQAGHASHLLRTVTPKRRPNADLRTREHLTEAEVERLMEATKRNRYGHRDATMILVAYRHGLRASELVDLRWDF
jgi:integrase